MRSACGLLNPRPTLMIFAAQAHLRRDPGTHHFTVMRPPGGVYRAAAITPLAALTGWFCSHQHLGDGCAEDLVQRSDPLNTKSKGRAESSAASRA
jgi:hypothetical protein